MRASSAAPAATFSLCATMRAWRAAQAFTSGTLNRSSGVQIVGSSTVTPRPTSRVIGAVGSGSLVRANPMYLPANYHNVRTVVFTAVRLQPQPFIVTPPHREATSCLFGLSRLPQ